MKKTISLIIVALFVSGCASVEMPLADGSDKTMSFRGFASTMTIAVPSGTDANGNPLGDKTVEINAHILEGPVVEAIKTIAPFAAMATQ
tara:strand:- start:1543 stop:1809 length:267 start_codon:yes stop_codon:yes gene_type:complete